MNTSIQHPELNGIVQPSGDSSQSEATLSALRKPSGPFVWVALLAGLLLLLFSAPSARAQGIPPGCTGSGIGITLFTSAPDVHVGDTICYGILVFNGTGVGPIVCDASNIVAFIVTPDGVSHPITLVRTYLSNGQSDYYPSVVCYVVRAVDILPDGTVRATASDTATIYQNDTPSHGGANQGVNTEVSQPCIKIAVQCVSSNDLIYFTGTVTNCGNNTLVGVTVTNFVNGGPVQVAFINILATNQVALFSGSWVPLNPCSPSTATFTAQGVDQYTTHPQTVTSSANTTCQTTLTPGIKVTKSCLDPVPPGQPFTFSGSVSNTGNVTLTNIVVVNNQPSNNTPVFTLPSLLPGAVANFNGSYPAPTNCSVTDTLTARASSVCGVAVTNSASATCTILTTPQITVTAGCPTAPVLPGGSLTNSVMVQNTGSFTLTNVVVFSDRPVPNTVVLTRASLASGVSTNFNVTYTVPANVCSVTTTFSGTGKDICTLNAVTNSALPTTCYVTTAPGIAVKLACPATNAVAGGLITYTGTVTNSGNVTLNNVTVVDNQASPSTVLFVPSLAAHASSNFTATFTAPTAGCSVSSTVTVTGSDNCTQNMVTNTASAGPCPLNTTPGIKVTKLCPDGQVRPGQPFIFTGSVSNTGNVTLTNIVVVNNQPVPNTTVFTQSSLAPGAVSTFTGSYKAPTNCSVTDTLIGTGRSLCGVAVSSTNSATCAILTTPLIAVTAPCPTNIVPGGSLTYSVTVQNIGDITLTNVVVFSDQPGPNPVKIVASLAPGVSTNFNAGPYTVPTNTCWVTNTFSVTGKDCTPTTATNNFLSFCQVITAPAIGVNLNCPTLPAVTGGLIIYTGTVTNSGNVILNNVTVVDGQSGTVLPVGSLSAHASAPFTVTNTAPTNACSVSDTVIVRGYDNCTQFMVTNTASTTNCTLNTLPGIKVTKTCFDRQVPPGQLLTFSGSVSNTGNVTLTNIVVVNNQPSNNTPVITVASLAPGAVTNFTRSYVAPTNCSVTDTLIATGRSFCGVVVSSTNSATCPIFTSPRIVVTTSCPTNQAGQGGLLTYSGTVSNAGNITLTNIIVVNNWPYSNVVFTAGSLAPGATTNFTGSYVVPLNCCQAWIWVVASGQGCDGVTVTDTDSRTCTVFTSPSIVVSKVCTAGVLRPGGLLTFSGTVSNAGNITLINVNAVDDQPANNTPVIWDTHPPGPINALAPGETAGYTGSYRVPPDFCGSDTVTASGLDVCSYALVTNSVTATCPIITTPLIGVSKQCPPQPTRHGGLLTFSGTVTNMGNVTLVNVFVVDNQPSNNTPVVGPITLAPGCFLNFTGSYTAPLVCCETIDTLTAHGQDRCSGSNVTATATAICPTLYTPGIALVQNCPPNPLPMGSEYVFSGFVTNTGDAILTNVMVFNTHPCQDNLPSGGPIDGQQPPLPLLGPIDLAPGESEPYTGCMFVPYNTCEVTVIVTSQETCKGTWITNTVSCPVAVNLGITITESCPREGKVTIGSSVNFGGLVCNTGNIPLNIVVFSGQPSNILPLGPIALDPGACTNFTGSYFAFGGFNPTTNSIIVTNFPGAITTNTATPAFGTIDPVSAAFTDHFNVVSNLHGFMYADQNENWGPTLFYSTRHPGSGPDTFDTISAAGVITPRFNLTETNYDALTLAAPDVGYGEINFYYLRHDTTNWFGEIIAQGASSSADLWPVTGTGYTGLAFAAANVGGYGANLFYYVRTDNTGLSTFGTINPTPGGVETDRYAVGTNFDALVFVPGAVSTWGTAIFAYLRHDTNGSIIGTIDPVTHVVTDRLHLGANFLTGLTFTATDVGFGANLFYYLRPASTILTTNTSNLPTYTTNIVVRFTPTNTVTAIGTDICQDSVTAAADCYGPIVPLVLVVGTSNSPANGFLMFSLSFPTQSGRSYYVQYKDALTDPIWLLLMGPLPGDGTTWTLWDSILPGQLTRFYRIEITTP